MTMMEREALPYSSAEPPFCHAVAPTGAIMLVELGGGRGRRQATEIGVGDGDPGTAPSTCNFWVGWGRVRAVLSKDKKPAARAGLDRLIWSAFTMGCPSESDRDASVLRWAHHRKLKPWRPL